MCLACVVFVFVRLLLSQHRLMPVFPLVVFAAVVAVWLLLLV